MTNAASYDYTPRDYTTTFEWLLTRLQSECPEITDLNHSQVAVALLRLMADTSQKLDYYLDQAFREGFVGIAQFKQSLIEIARTVDYLPTLASPAATTLELTRLEGVTGDIPVPQYTAFSRSDGVQYLTTLGATILDGSDTTTVDAIEGTRIELTIEPDDWETIDETGRVRYSLGTNVAAGTVSLEHHDPAYVWTEVDSFWESESTDRHFLCLLQADPIVTGGDTDTVWLILGDGTNGQAPPAEDMTCAFLQTSGADGNCGYSVITSVPDEFLTYLTATNTTAATGGAAAETIASLRLGIPAVTHAQRRAVTKRDYEALIEHVAGVLHCQAIDRNDDQIVNTYYEWPHEYVVLYVVPDGGGAMSTALKNDIWAECGLRGVLGSWSGRYILRDITEVPVNVTCTIGVQTGYDPATVSAAVETALTDFFDAENQEINGIVKFTDINLTAGGVSGVSWAEFTTPQQDITTDIGEFPTAGTVTVTVQ